MKRDPTGGSKDTQEIAHNKGRSREYIELFPSGRIDIAMKEEQYDSVGPENIEGHRAVQDLAEILVSLRENPLVLTREECTRIITLWPALGHHHQTTLKQRRFRAN
ncbi:hypothetical protein E1301_Tti006450 [Triplophysa tibetana]|uniref:Uncharacterized protein n=1 Tax=Triplophysa tibetana TaxID=1572043 RepID=A0A5A9NY03_9TELE|nr:hypothetical protein E1301_Tti006450 [Triplophysa tibetana]